MSYRIVQKHLGRLEVDSELGKGTRVRVFLPIRQSARGAPVTQQISVTGAV